MLLSSSGALAADAPKHPTRAELVETFQLASWRFYQVVRETAPELLWHRYQETQYTLSPYLPCSEGPLEKIDNPHEQLKAALVSVQGALEAYLSNPENALFKTTRDVPLPSDPEAVLELAKPLAEGKFRCIPAESFARPDQWGKDPGKVRLNKVRADKYESLLQMTLKTGDGPVAVALGNILPHHPISNKELVQWMLWVGYLRKIYADYQSLQSNEAPTLPHFQVNGKLGAQLDAFQKTYGFLRAEAAVGTPRATGRLRSEELKADEMVKKILTATAIQKQNPRFEPCSASAPSEPWCFREGEPAVEDALTDRVILKLHSPRLGYASYLDSFIDLAKQGQIQELTFINLILPETLKFKDLPAACFSGGDAAVTATDREMEGLRALFQRFGRQHKREWLVQQITKSAEILALDIQHRNKPVIFPAAAPQTFEFNGKNTDFFKLADSLAAEWFERFVKMFDEKIKIHHGNSAGWTQLQQNVRGKFKSSPFEAYIRFQEGLGAQDDFLTVLAEKMIVLFSTVAPDLADQEEIDHYTPDQVFRLNELFLLQAVQSAMIESMSTYIATIVRDEDFSSEDMEQAKDGMLLGLELWEQEFAPTWRAAIEMHGQSVGSDLRRLAKTLADQLKTTGPYKDVVEGKAKFDPQAVAKDVIDRRLEHGRPLWEQAARAEQTTQYLQEVLDMKSDLVTNFLPALGGWLNPWNYRYIEDLAPQYSGPATFHFKGNDGVNPFGDLDPKTPADFEHFRKVLSAIAHRKQRELVERLKKAVDEATVKNYGFADYEGFARQIVHRWDVLLQAKPKLDSVHVTELREEAFEPLVQYLNRYSSAARDYRRFTKSLIAGMYHSEIAPLLRGAEKFAPEDRVYLANYVEKVLAPRIQLPGKTKLTLPLVEHAFAQSGEKDRAAVQSAFDELDKALRGMEQKGLYPTVDVPTPELQAAKFIETARKEPEYLRQRISYTRDFLKTNAAKLLFEATVAQNLTIPFLTTKTGTTDFPSAVQALDADILTKATIIQRSLYMFAMPNEHISRWAAGRKIPGWEMPLIKFIARHSAPLKPGEKITDPCDRVAMTNPPVEHYELAKEQCKSVVALLNARTQVVQQNVMPELMKMLNEAAKIKELNDDSLAEFLHKYVRSNPQLFDTFAAAVNEVNDFVEKNLSAPNDEMLQVAFIGFRTANSLTFSDTFAQSPVLEETRRGQGKNVETFLAENLFASFEDARTKLLTEINETIALRVEPIEAIIELEKDIERMEDEIDLSTQQDKKDEIKTSNRVLSRLELRRQDYRNAIAQVAEMRSLLEYLSGAFAPAAAAIKSLAEAPDDSIKLERLFVRFATEKNAIDKDTGRMSAQDIVADLNELVGGGTQYYPIDVRVALVFLEDVQKYAKAARTDGNRPVVEKWYQETLNNMAADAATSGRVAASGQRRLLGLYLRNQVVGWLNSVKSAFMPKSEIQDLQGAATHIDSTIKNFNAAKNSIDVDLKKMPSANVVLDELAARAERVEKDFKGRIEIAKKTSKALSSEDFKHKRIESEYWTLVQDVSDLLVHANTKFSSLALKNEDTGLIDGVYLRSSPLNRAFHQVDYGQRDYVPNPAVIASGVTNLLVHPKFPFGEIFSAEVLKEMKLEAPKPEQSLVEWYLGLSADHRYDIYFRIEKKLEEGILAGTPWVGALAKEWAIGERKVEAYPDQYEAWMLSLSAQLALFKSLARKIFSIDAKTPDMLGLIAYNAANTFFDSTLYRLESNGELTLETSFPETTKLAATKKILDQWLADYQSTDPAKAEAKIAARGHWLTLVESIWGLFAFSMEGMYSREHVAFYVNPADLRPDATPTNIRFFQNTYKSTPESRFLGFYFTYFKQGRLAFNHTMSDAAAWDEHYMVAEARGVKAVQYPQHRFMLAWKPNGKKANDLEIFDGWIKTMQKETSAPDTFATWSAKPPSHPYPRKRIWEVYPNFQKYLDSAAHKYIRDFLARWDANAAATADVETLPMFFALLEESLAEGSTGMVPGVGVSEAETSGYLKELLALIPLRLDDFESWKTVTSDRNLTQPEDWFLMAQSRLALVADAGRNRQFSVLIGGTERAGTLYNRTYHPFPASLNDPKDGKFNYRTPRSFGAFVAPALDKTKTVLWKVFSSDDAMPAYRRFVGDSLELQDEYEIKARDRALFANGGTVDQDTPYVRDRLHTFGGNFARYFETVNAEIETRRIEEIIAAVTKQFPDANPQQLRERILTVVKRHLDYVALEKMANEGLTEGQANSLLRAFEVRIGWKDFLAKMKWDLKLPAVKVQGTLPDASEEIAAQVAYTGRGMMYAQLTVGRTKAERDQIDHILATTKMVYLNDVQTRTYYEEIRAIGQKVFENLERLCKEPSFEGRVKDDEDFKAKKTSIWGYRLPVVSSVMDYLDSDNWDLRQHKADIMNLRLPMMSGLMEQMNDVAPTAAGDDARRMLRMLLIDEEKELREMKTLENMINVGLLASLSLQATSRMSPRMGAWIARSFAAQTFNRVVGYGLGALFFAKFGYHMNNDFRAFPARLERFRSVRDTAVLGINPLVSNEDASTADDAERALATQQFSVYSWLGRAWDVSLSINSFVVPTIKAVFNIRNTLNASQRWAAWSWEASRMAKVFKTGFTYESVLRAQLKREAEMFVKQGGKFLLIPENASEKELWDVIDEAIEEFIKRRGFPGEFANGYWLPTLPMAKLLAKDVDTQIKSAVEGARLHPATLESTLAAPAPEALSEANDDLLRRLSKSVYRRLPFGWGEQMPSSGFRAWAAGRDAKGIEEFAKFQEQTRARIQYLREIRQRLMSERPHVSVDDLKQLLGAQGSSIFARHTPFVMMFTGLNIPTANPLALIRYYQISRLNAAINAGMDMQQGMSFMLLSNWMDRYLLKGATGGEALLKLAASRRSITAEQLIDAMVKGEFANVGGQELREAAQELREFFQLSGMSATPDMIRAIAANDRGALLQILKRSRYRYVHTTARAIEPKPEAEAGAPATEIAGEFVWDARKAFEGAEKGRSFTNIATYESELERVVGGRSVRGRPLDIGLMKQLIRDYDSYTLQRLLGEKFMRAHGPALRSEAIEVRIALHYRRAMEIERAAGLRPTTSEFFVEVGTQRSAAATIDSLADAPMSVEEAMGVLRMKPSQTWHEAQLEQLQLAALRVADNDAVNQAWTRLHDLVPAVTAETKTLSQMAELSGMQTAFRNPQVMNNVLISSEGQTQLSILGKSDRDYLAKVYKPLSEGATVSKFDATETLRLPYSERLWTEELITSRTNALCNEIEMLYGGDLTAAHASSMYQRALTSEQVARAVVAGGKK